MDMAHQSDDSKTYYNNMADKVDKSDNKMRYVVLDTETTGLDPDDYVNRNWMH